MKQISMALSLLVVTFFTGMISAQETTPELNTKSLVALEGEEDVKKVKTRESAVSLSVSGGQKVLKVDFKASPKYPDVEFSAPSGTWDLSGYGGIRAEIINPGQAAVKIAIRADNPGASSTDKKFISGGGEIEPGTTRMIELSFSGVEKSKKGKEKATYILNPAEVTAVHIFISQPKNDVSLMVKSIQAFGAPREAAVKPAAAEVTEQMGIVPVVKNEPWTKPLLLDFADANAKSLISTNDSTFDAVDVNGAKAIRVKMGCKSPYPNISFKPPEGAWNLAAYTHVEFGLTNNSNESITLAVRVDNPNATGRANSNGGKISLDPGESGIASVEIDRYFAEEMREKLQGMYFSPWGPRSERGSMIDPANVVQVSLFLNTPSRPYDITVHSIKATGVFDPKSEFIPEPFFPFIDRYGQYIHQDWPGKVKEDGDLIREKTAELKYIDTNPRPSNWNRYGGWADGPQLNATGHFYTAKHNGKWHLVDPEGRLFFSLGMAVVQMKNHTPIDRREGWFSEEPWKNEKEFGKFVGKTKENGIKHGDYKGMSLRTFSFYGANLQRKYGSDYENVWEDLMPRRLMNWGFNTIGNWSEPKVLKKGGIPYTDWVFLQVKNLPWQANTRNPIPDPFNPEFDAEVKKAVERFAKDSVNDPMCIGYFVDNELSWRDDTFQAKAALAGNKDNPAKVEFVKYLESSYGTIEKLNQAWGSKLSNWEAMISYKEIPQTEAGIKDLRAFNAKIARRYFEVVSKAVKEVAPKKLYLGCRFADYNAQVEKIASEYCDVVSFNIYRETIAAWKPLVEIEKPILIGEFHFGATDRGVFGPGLVRAKNAVDRSVKFSRYVMGAASNPSIVGVHWFCLLDQPAIGNALKGENYGVGFLSVTDTPYLEMIEASRKAAQEIYVTRSK